MTPPDTFSIVAAAVGTWLVGIQPDMSEMFWGAVGGYVGMSRSTERGSIKSQAGTLAASAACAGALTDLLSHIGHEHVPTAALTTIATATAFLLGWGFFKVADPLVAMGLDAVKAFLNRLAGGPTQYDIQPIPQKRETDQGQGAKE